MNKSSLFTYAEARTICDSQPNLAVRRVVPANTPTWMLAKPIAQNERTFGIWDVEADEWLISDLAREYLAKAVSQMPLAEEA